jgi:hypothetical protein
MNNPLERYAGSISVVVSSCDRFFDAWRPFAFFFQKYWSDCPFPIYLITNELHVQSARIQAIRVGRDKGWATTMQRALAHIDTPYILYLQEDYFLTAPVRTEQLASDIAHAVEQNATSFCFYDLSLLEPEFGQQRERFGIVPEHSLGRTRLQATLWKRDAFASLLRPGDTAWNMEARGSERTRGMLMLSYAQSDGLPIPYLMSAIVRGLWTPEAIALCQRHNLRIRPAFRSLDPGTNRGRRWRRAIDRVRLPIALALQGDRPVDLDRPADASHRYTTSK